MLAQSQNLVGKFAWQGTPAPGSAQVCCVCTAATAEPSWLLPRTDPVPICRSNGFLVTVHWVFDISRPAKSGNPLEILSGSRADTTIGRLPRDCLLAPSIRAEAASTTNSPYLIPQTAAQPNGELIPTKGIKDTTSLSPTPPATTPPATFTAAQPLHDDRLSGAPPLQAVMLMPERECPCCAAKPIPGSVHIREA